MSFREETPWLDSSMSCLIIEHWGEYAKMLTWNTISSNETISETAHFHYFSKVSCRSLLYSIPFLCDAVINIFYKKVRKNIVVQSLPGTMLHWATCYFNKDSLCVLIHSIHVAFYLIDDKFFVSILYLSGNKIISAFSFVLTWYMTTESCIAAHYENKIILEQQCFFCCYLLAKRRVLSNSSWESCGRRVVWRLSMT